MDDPSGPKPPLRPGRGVLSADYFCEVAGMDPALLRSLVNDGRIDGLVNTDGHVVRVFDDALPSAEWLRAMGAQPSSGYDPDRLRAYEGDHDEEDDAADAEANHEDDGVDRSSWTMSWHD